MEETMARTSLYGFDMREPDLRRSEDRKTYDIKSLWQRSHEILALALRGMKQVEIAEVLDISPQTVSNTLNSDLGRQKLSIMRKGRDEKAVEVSERIEDLTEKALEVYDEIFNNAGDLIPIDMRKKTADTVMLELSGHRAATKIHSVSTTATLKEIEEFKARGIQAQRDAGMIVDVIDENGKEEVENNSVESDPR